MDNVSVCLIPDQIFLGIMKKLSWASVSRPDSIKWMIFLANGIEREKSWPTCLTQFCFVEKCLKGHQTTLISKVDDQKRLPGSVASGSIILSAFSGVLNARLTKACQVHKQQWDFIESRGYSKILGTLKGIMKLSKRERKPLSVVLVDFTNTLDSVSHEHILEVFACV